MECFVWNGEAEGNAGLVDDLVPAVDAADGVLDIVIAQHLVEGVEHRYLLLHQVAVLHVENLVAVALKHMVVGALGFVEATLQAGGVEGGGVARLVGAEQVYGHAEVEVQIALNSR